MDPGSRKAMQNAADAFRSPLLLNELQAILPRGVAALGSVHLKAHEERDRLVELHALR